MRSGLVRTFVAAGIILGGLSVAHLRGQTTAPNPMPPTQPPTTAPASAAAVVPVDLKSPRGALKMLLTSITSGDAAGIKKVIHATTATEEKMVDALVHRAVAEKKFQQAAIKAFGADAAKALVGDTEASTAANMSQLDAATETITGESAIVTTGASEPVKLIKVSGEWTVAASEFSKDADPVKIQQSIDANDFAAGLIDQFAADVGSGKYKTATEAGESIQLQLRAAMDKYAMSRGAATTPGPSTGPTSGPG